MEEGQKEKQTEVQMKKRPATYVYFGILFGIALGAAWQNVGLGLVLGAAAGYAYYQYKVKSNNNKKNNNKEPDKE